MFLTGQNEVHALCYKLRRTFNNELGKKCSKQGNMANNNFCKKKKATKFSLDKYVFFLYMLD